jgi:hypothetical protein
MKPRLNAFTKHNGFTAFAESCMRGHFKIAKWLYRITSNYYQCQLYDYSIFHFACANGHLQVVQWLNEICPIMTDNMSEARYIFIQLTFRYAAEKGHCKILQFLNHLIPGICADQYDILFQLACQMNHLNTAEWFVLQCPHNFRIVSYDERSIQYEIKEKEKEKE